MLQTLEQDVIALHLRKEIFTELDAEIVRMQMPGSGAVCDQFLRPMYFESQAMIVRRLADTNSDSITFANLLGEMSAYAPDVSRARYLGPYEARGEELWTRVGNRSFDDLAGVGANHMPAERLRAYRDDLLRDADTMRVFVNKYVAHRDKKPPPRPTWGHLGEAISRTTDHLNRVTHLLRSNSVHLEGIASTGVWRAVFQQGLFIRPLSEWRDGEMQWTPSFT